MDIGRQRKIDKEKEGNIDRETDGLRLRGILWADGLRLRDIGRGT